MEKNYHRDGDAVIYHPFIKKDQRNIIRIREGSQVYAISKDIEWNGRNRAGITSRVSSSG